MAELLRITPKDNVAVALSALDAGVTVTVDGQVRQTIDIVSAQAVERLTVPGIFKGFLDRFFMAK